MQADHDGVGEVFRRLCLMRLEFGEAVLDRTVRDVLQTLGAAAHREAEVRARKLAARSAPGAGDITVAPFVYRKRPAPWLDD